MADSSTTTYYHIEKLSKGKWIRWATPDNTDPAYAKEVLEYWRAEFPKSEFRANRFVTTIESHVEDW